MDKKIREQLQGMFEEGSDLEKQIKLCMYKPFGISVDTGDSKEPHWFNRHEDLEVYDNLIKIYKTPNENGLPRVSHGVCSEHKYLLGI